MNPFSKDQLPPHDLQAERATVGCALQDPGLASELRTDWFYDLRCRQAAATLLDMAANSRPIDIATAFQAMNANGITDVPALIAECESASPSPANFPYWRDILVEKQTLRRVIQVAQAAILDAFSSHENHGSKPSDCLDDFEHTVLSIRQQITGVDKGEVDKKAVLNKLINDYEDAYNSGRPRGLPTGFHALDKLIGGLKPQQLFVIAARPSVGKTALALDIARHIAFESRTPVGFFSLEMSGEELIHRLACSRAGVDGTSLNDGSASLETIQKMAMVLPPIKTAPLHIDDTGGLTVAKLFAKARSMVQRHGIKILVIDYLGLLKSGERGRSRYEETTLVSNALKTLAKELNVPVVALAQLNRDTERENRAPRLSDLRDSGAIEQDADIVALLHRNEEQQGDAQTLSIILAKQRSGRTGKVDLIFNRPFTRFEN